VTHGENHEAWGRGYAQKIKNLKKERGMKEPNLSNQKRKGASIVKVQLVRDSILKKGEIQKEISAKLLERSRQGMLSL